MIDVTPEYLLNIVDEETAFKIWEQLEGIRIYFLKNLVKHSHLIEDYKQLIKNYYKRAEAVKELEYNYEMSNSQIRRITSKVDLKPFE